MRVGRQPHARGQDVAAFFRSQREIRVTAEGLSSVATVASRPCVLPVSF